MQRVEQIFQLPPFGAQKASEMLTEILWLGPTLIGDPPSSSGMMW
jgi:hypothetical protein